MADLARGGAGVVGRGIAGKERKKLRDGCDKAPTIKGPRWWSTNLAIVGEGRIRVMIRVVEDWQGRRGRSWPRVVGARDSIWEGAMESLLGKKTIKVVASLLSSDHVVFDMHWLHG
jgi:hypothetical protein